MLRLSALQLLKRPLGFALLRLLSMSEVDTYERLVAVADTVPIIAVILGLLPGRNSSLSPRLDMLLLELYLKRVECIPS